MPVAAAIGSGDVQKLLAVLRAGGRVDVVGLNPFSFNPSYHCNALHHLVRVVARDGSSWREMASVLLEFGCDVNGADLFGSTPLHLAAEAGLTDVCEFLLTNGANIDAVCQGPWRRKPIHMCVVVGKQETFTFIAGKGAPIGVALGNPHAPLHLVAVYGCWKQMLLFLIGKGLDINELTLAGMSPLELIPRQGLSYMNAIHAFIAAGAVASPKMLVRYLPKSREGRAIRTHRLRAAILAGCPKIVDHVLASLSPAECSPYLKSALLKADLARQRELAAFEIKAVIGGYVSRLALQEF